MYIKSYEIALNKVNAYKSQNISLLIFGRTAAIAAAAASRKPQQQGENEVDELLFVIFCSF